MEQIYTIPVNEAFERCAKMSIRDDVSACRCPFCELHDKYENDEIDLILGASMMEPEIRKKTNEKGFCADHFAMMLAYGKRLPLALILESHLDTVRAKVKSGSFLAQSKAGKSVKSLDRLGESCYVCERMGYNFDRSVEAAVILWESDVSFREKCLSQPYFCLPHFAKFVALAKDKLSKKDFTSFYNDVSQVESAYFDKISGDVSHFVKKFDYRYTEEPWGDAKDSPERAIAFLSSDLHRPPEGKKPSDGLT